jgi:hypothetical protein
MVAGRKDDAAPPGLKFILVWDAKNMPRLPTGCGWGQSALRRFSLSSFRKSGPALTAGGQEIRPHPRENYN